MAFLELYTKATGSNVNSGSTNSDFAHITYDSGFWTSTTGVFDVPGGNPIDDGVAVGDIASIYPDDAEVTPFLARVTARTAVTITVSLTAKAGTAPPTGSNTSLRIGGRLAGPSAALAFPFGFLATSLTSAAGDFFRCNMIGTFNVTAAINHALAGPGIFQGMTSTPGDGGKFTLDGGTSGASYTLLTIGNESIKVVDGIFQNNGATGNATGVFSTQFGVVFHRCVFRNIRGAGLQASQPIAEECEFTACNQSNSANVGAVNAAGTGGLRRCYVHDCPGSNVQGIRVTNGPCIVDRCIVDTVGGPGIAVTIRGGVSILNTDVYNSGGDSINLSGTPSGVILENCNLVKAGGYFINSSVPVYGFIRNCGFGSGSQGASSGQTNGVNASIITDSVTYGADKTPWLDPANGDFRIVLPDAIGSGRGSFLQIDGGNTVAYPDRGAAQHRDQPPVIVSRRFIR